MKIAEAQATESALAQIGAEAVALFRKRDFQSLAERFGYALAFGRDLSAALEEDLATSLSEFSEGAYELKYEPRIAVRRFSDNASNLYAVIECLEPVSDGRAVLLELVVTSTGEEKHVTLEQISAAA